MISRHGSHRNERAASAVIGLPQVGQAGNMLRDRRDVAVLGERPVRPRVPSGQEIVLLDDAALKHSHRPRVGAGMSDAYDYFMSHAVAAVHRARAMRSSPLKRKQRTVARVYHLLAKEFAYAPNVHHLDDFRVAKRLQRQIDGGS